MTEKGIWDDVKTIFFRRERTGGGAGRLLLLTVRWWAVDEEKEKSNWPKSTTMNIALDLGMGGVLVFTVLFLFCSVQEMSL
jgi:hypothetical protein